MSQDLTVEQQEYLSGHGWTRKDGGKLWYHPGDAQNFYTPLAAYAMAKTTEESQTVRTDDGQARPTPTT